MPHLCVVPCACYRVILFSPFTPIANWPLTTLWLTDEHSQSAQAYKHASLVNKIRGRVVFENNSEQLFWAVQIELWGRTDVVLFTLLVCMGRAIRLLARGQQFGHCWFWSLGSQHNITKMKMEPLRLQFLRPLCPTLGPHELTFMWLGCYG